MRILHLIYDDVENPWLGGGGSFATYEINKRLAKKCNITVVTGNYPGAKNEAKSGIKYIRVGSTKNYILSRITYSLNIKKIIKESKYDLLVDDFSPFSPTFSYKHSKKPIICILRNIFGSHLFKEYSIFGVIPFFFEKLALKHYKNIIVYSKSMHSKLINKIPQNSRSFLLKRGINYHYFSKKPKEKNYILYLGRIDIYQKGIDLLLKAFLRLNIDTKLIIAGSGPKKQITKMLNLINKLNLSDKVKYIGRVSGKKKLNYLLNCLFLCCPSRYESWGATAIEASVSSKPVLATNIEGFKDSVKDGITGILARKEDINAISNAMMLLLKNKKLRKKLGKNGRKFAKQFDWNNIIKEQEKIYNKIKNI